MWKSTVFLLLTWMVSCSILFISYLNIFEGAIINDEPNRQSHLLKLVLYFGPFLQRRKYYIIFTPTTLYGADILAFVLNWWLSLVIWFKSQIWEVINSGLDKSWLIKWKITMIGYHKSLGSRLIRFFCPACVDLSLCFAIIVCTSSLE